MNRQTIAALIGKDWYYSRTYVLAFAFAAVLGLVLLALPGLSSFYAGTVLLISALFAVGAQLVFVTVLYERRDQTLAFIMTLPISTQDYTSAKILANVGIFGVVWLLLLLLSALLILTRSSLPDGLLPYACVVLVQILIAYLMMLLAAVVRESEGWTIAAMVVGSFLMQGVMFAIPRFAGVDASIRAEQLSWHPVMIWTLLAQFVFIAALLRLTFWSQARKRDFL
jgi:hypothetical protein